MSHKRYVVLESNNFETDIYCSDKIIPTKKEAKRVLSHQYRELKSIIEKDRIESCSKTPEGYSLLDFGGNFYYGVVKEIEV